MGLNARGAAFDVADEESVTQPLSNTLTARALAIDILVNNAGIQHRQPLLEVSLQDWTRVLDTNLTAAFLVGRAAAGA